MRPVIGITPQVTDDEKKITLSTDYISLIEDNGGLASILNYSSLDNIYQQLNIIDGLLLTGGGDIDPLFFSEQPINKLGTITPMRDEYELALCRTALEMDIPILGICRGIQILAVATGGKIAQDIYECYENSFILKHAQDAPRWYPSHQIFIYKDTLLREIVGCEGINVNSFHHQAVSEIGEEMIVSAISYDGIIEAIEHTKKSFAIGVQWHPENMYLRDHFQQRIAEVFIKNCKGQA